MTHITTNYLPGDAADALEASSIDLFASAYADMRRIAANCFESERRDHTLTPTALVHEAWLKLAGMKFGAQTDRRHFYSCAARTMRRVLIDHARTRATLKRGGDRTKLPLDAVDLVAAGDCDQIILLEAAVSRLEKQDSELAEIVRLRFYAGLTSEQAAHVMDLPLRTFKRRWSLARGYLMREFERSCEESAHDAE